MKDNFAEDIEETVGEFFEQRRDEFRAIKRARRFMHAIGIAAFFGSVAWISLFDVRLGCGCLLLALSIMLMVRYGQ